MVYSPTCPTDFARASEPVGDCISPIARVPSKVLIQVRLFE